MNKEQVLADIETLVKMCRSKSDGASLVVEEEEVKTKISDIQAEMDEIKIAMEEESYDSSAEMADRNIEIILKKLIQTLNSDVKTKSSELEDLSKDEHILNEKVELLKDNIKNCENFITSINERLENSNDPSISSKYASQIEDTKANLINLNKELESENKEYTTLQNKIEELSNDLTNIKDKIEKKSAQLTETQDNLENKEIYINHSKKQKSEKKIRNLESKKQKLEERLLEIQKDPKYLEIKIRRTLSTSDDIFDIRNYINILIDQAKKVPFLERDADKSLEEELLKATQSRDEFASKIEKKTYNLLETLSPAQIRIDFLHKKIESWNQDIEELQKKAKTIDNDLIFNYNEKCKMINDMINEKKDEINKYTETLKNEPDDSAKTTLKVLLDDTKKDLNEAERIYNAFKVDETNDIKRASKIVKVEIADLKSKIEQAEAEIADTYTRLQAKTTGLTDISAQNKDKEHLRELATVVVNIKHRRQFTEKPSQIGERLLKNFKMLEQPTNPSPEIETKKVMEPTTEVTTDTTESEISQTKEVTAPIEIVPNNETISIETSPETLESSPETLESPMLETTEEVAV